jgi:NAD-dependent deacetylase
MRPHVLWFDESYDEERFRFASALRAADTCALLVVVGTSGATNLPTLMCERVARRGAALIVVDPEETPFSQLAGSSSGAVIRKAACAAVPTLTQAIARALGAR